MIVSLAVLTGVLMGSVSIYEESLQRQKQVEDASSADICAGRAATLMMSGKPAVSDGSCHITTDVESGWISIEADVGQAKQILWLPQAGSLN